jgi:prevent-host-death family protein
LCSTTTRFAAVQKLLQHRQAFLDVFNVQPCGWFVHTVSRPSESLIQVRLVYILVCNEFVWLEDVMKIEIGSYEAKTKLPELLRQVKAGKSFTITNRGEAIADLVPSAGVRTKDKVSAAEKLKAFMLADPVSGVNIKALIEEGRA